MDKLLSENGCPEPERYACTVVVRKNLIIPVFGGSMLRGAMGHALLDQCGCHAGQPHDPGCIYTELFETAAGTGFVITPPAPASLEAGETFRFQLTLLRPDENRRRAVFRALDVALALGLTQERVPCRLLEVSPQKWLGAELGKIAVLHLLSPWFIKRKGDYVRASDCSLHCLLIAMAQRQRNLFEQGLLDARLPDNAQLLQTADQLNCHLRLVDCSGERHSNRQRSRHPLFGIKGTATIVAPPGVSLEPLKPLFRTAEWVHGGGKVSFGLGGLVVQGQTELSSGRP